MKCKPSRKKIEFWREEDTAMCLERKEGKFVFYVMIVTGKKIFFHALKICTKWLLRGKEEFNAINSRK